MQQPSGSWAEAQAALLEGPALGDNGKTVSGAGPATPGPNLTPKIATGNARMRKETRRSRLA